jgi:hypothetical protein
MSNGGGHWCVTERVIDMKLEEELGKSTRTEGCRSSLQFAGNVTRRSSTHFLPRSKQLQRFAQSSSSDGMCYEKPSSQPSEQNTCCLAFCQP